MVFLVVKALHVVAVISWMAGLLYLPRLFVYHCDAASGSTQSETFKVMERRLMRAIMNPAMFAVWGLGLYMAYDANYWLAGWFIAKMVLVAALTVVHHLYAAWRKDFERDANVRPARFYRIWNEAPTLLMIGIVFLVILKPF